MPKGKRGQEAGGRQRQRQSELRSQTEKQNEAPVTYAISLSRSTSSTQQSTHLVEGPGGSTGRHDAGAQYSHLDPVFPLSPDPPEVSKHSDHQLLINQTYPRGTDISYLTRWNFLYRAKSVSKG